MLAAKGLNILEHPRQRSVVELGAQGGEIGKKSPSLIGGDAPFPFIDERRIEDLGAPKGRHQVLVPAFSKSKTLMAAGVRSSGKHQDRVEVAGSSPVVPASYLNSRQTPTRPHSIADVTTSHVGSDIPCKLQK